MPLQYRCRLVAGGPGNRTPMSEREPHHDLNNPVEEPDPTEWPDPYEKRRDPKGPEEGDEEPAPGPSTSEPHPPRNRDRERGGE
jgi:hypothetical protein